MYWDGDFFLFGDHPAFCGLGGRVQHSPGGGLRRAAHHPGGRAGASASWRCWCVALPRGRDGGREPGIRRKPCFPRVSPCPVHPLNGLCGGGSSPPKPKTYAASGQPFFPAKTALGDSTVFVQNKNKKTVFVPLEWSSRDGTDRTSPLGERADQGPMQGLNLERGRKPKS